MNPTEVKVAATLKDFNKQKEDIFIYGDGDGPMKYRVKKPNKREMKNQEITK